MSNEDKTKTKPVDPRVLLGLKFGGLFLGILLAFLLVGLVLFPLESSRRESFRATQLEELSRGRGLGEFRALDTSSFSGFYELEDGGAIALLTSVVHQSQGNLAVLFDSERVPVSIVPLSVPWYGRLTKAFPGGQISAEYRPEMGVRALFVYQAFSQGELLR